MTVCADCGDPIPDTLDSVRLCADDLRVAIAVAGSGEARMQQLAKANR